MPGTRQVKSKQRVADYGEVFTAPREVNAMLDLVKPAFERIDATFLDPACGDGNFLTEILRRKFELVERESRTPGEYERNALIALGAVYGVEIQDDNAQECRERLLKQWLDAYNERMGENGDDDARNQAREIVKLNIVRGDFLTARTVDKRGRDTGEPIFMFHWYYEGNELVAKRDRLEEEAGLFSYGQDSSSTSAPAAPLEEDSASASIKSPEEREVDNTEPLVAADKKKSRSKGTSAVKRRAKSTKKATPQPEPAASSEPTSEPAHESLPEPAAGEIEPAQPAHDATPTAQALEPISERATPQTTTYVYATNATEERFPISSPFPYGGSANVIEMTMPVVRRLYQLIHERRSQITDPWEIEKTRDDLRAMQEMVAIFWSNLVLPKDKNNSELIVSAHNAYKLCLQCVYSIQSLTFLTEDEVNEFVAVFDHATKALTAIIDQGV